MPKRTVDEFTRFVVEQPVQIEPGVTLVPGRYSGRKSITMDVGLSDHTETAAEYEIELTADELKGCGCSIGGELVSETIRITRHVEAGKITAA